jgi:transcriptional regulator with XRE-family HTH domain
MSDPAPILERGTPLITVQRDDPKPEREQEPTTKEMPPLLVKMRHRKGITQSQLAKIVPSSRLDRDSINVSYLNRLEDGKRDGSPEIIGALGIVLCENIDEFLEFTDASEHDTGRLVLLEYLLTTSEIPAQSRKRFRRDIRSLCIDFMVENGVLSDEGHKSNQEPSQHQ